MSSPSSINGPLQPVESSSSSNSNLLVRRPTKRREISLTSFSSEEDNEVQFDSKQLVLFYVMVLPSMTCSLVCHPSQF